MPFLQSVFFSGAQFSFVHDCLAKGRVRSFDALAVNVHGANRHFVLTKSPKMAQNFGPLTESRWHECVRANCSAVLNPPAWVKPEWKTYEYKRDVLVDVNGMILLYFQGWHNNPALLRRAVRSNGEALQFMPFCDEQDLVQDALRTCGAMLKHASVRLQARPDVVMCALQEDGSALEFASGELQASKPHVLVAVRTSCRALPFCRLKTDGAVVCAAIAHHLACPCALHPWVYPYLWCESLRTYTDALAETQEAFIALELCMHVAFRQRFRTCVAGLKRHGRHAFLHFKKKIVGFLVDLERFKEADATRRWIRSRT